MRARRPTGPPRGSSSSGGNGCSLPGACSRSIPRVNLLDARQATATNGRTTRAAGGPAARVVATSYRARRRRVASEVASRSEARPASPTAGSDPAVLGRLRAVVATGCWGAAGAGAAGGGGAGAAAATGAGAGAAAGAAALASVACTSRSETTWGGLVVTIVADNLSP